MPVKEAKRNPWAILKASAEKAETPNTAKSWNSRKSGRKEGDVLMGIVGETREAVTTYGPGKVMDIITPDGKKETLFLSIVLENCIESVGGFAKGDKVFVKYLGVPKGKRYSSYAVGKV